MTRSRDQTQPTFTEGVSSNSKHWSGRSTTHAQDSGRPFRTAVQLPETSSSHLSLILSSCGFSVPPSLFTVKLLFVKGGFSFHIMMCMMILDRQAHPNTTMKRKIALTTNPTFVNELQHVPSSSLAPCMGFSSAQSQSKFSSLKWNIFALFFFIYWINRFLNFCQNFKTVVSNVILPLFVAIRLLLASK